jgi:chaperonin cofactor prefoldin
VNPNKSPGGMRTEISDAIAIAKAQLRKMETGYEQEKSTLEKRLDTLTNTLEMITPEFEELATRLNLKVP